MPSWLFPVPRCQISEISWQLIDSFFQKTCWQLQAIHDLLLHIGKNDKVCDLRLQSAYQTWEHQGSTNQQLCCGHCVSLSPEPWQHNTADPVNDKHKVYCTTAHFSFRLYSTYIILIFGAGSIKVKRFGPITKNTTELSLTINTIFTSKIFGHQVKVSDKSTVTSLHYTSLDSRNSFSLLVNQSICCASFSHTIPDNDFLTDMHICAMIAMLHTGDSKLLRNTLDVIYHKAAVTESAAKSVK